MFLSVFFDIALLIFFVVHQLLISAAKVLIFIHICNLRHSIFFSLYLISLSNTMASPIVSLKNDSLQILDS